MIPEFTVWMALALLVFIAGFIGMLFSLIPTGNANSRYKSLIFVSFSMLGMALGFLSANSREPVMHALVPGLLTFIGGFTAYLLNKKNDMSLLVSTCMICLIVTLFIGICFGVKARETYLIANEGQPLLLRLQNQADTEMLINNYRSNLGLAPLKPPLKQYLTESENASGKSD